jgi:hypothetical protein
VNSDVHPAIVALVLMLTAIAIALWIWGSDLATGIGGPAELRSDPRGHHFIQIQNYLVEHDADGDYVETHDLSAIDVELFLGTYAFFSNGDLLLRRGPDPRSFGDNVRAFQRRTNEQSIIPEKPDSGLFRCDLDVDSCERFGASGIDFKAAHGVFIDWRSDVVYITDTTRHLLRKYSADGIELRLPVGGFKFPNQLLMHDDKLLVANTNHHTIDMLNTGNSTFGERIEKIDVVPTLAKSHGQEWPSHFARVGSEWWVNNMQNGMNLGGVYIFDDTWQFDRKVDLPVDADPISILPLSDEVWVSDWNDNRVRRFTTAGRALPDLESAGLDAILTASRLERRKYEMVSYSGIGLIVFVLLGLMVRALAVSMNKGPVGASRQKAAEDLPVSTSVLHLEPDSKALRKMATAARIAGGLLLSTVALLGFILITYEEPALGLWIIVPVIGMFAILALIVWTTRGNTGTAINLKGNVITLRDHVGRESSCPIHEVRYDETAIATHDAVVFLGRPMAAVYERRLLEEQLIPRLADANKVGPLKMMQIFIKLRHPQGVTTVIAVITLVIYAIWAIAVRQMVK